MHTPYLTRALFGAVAAILCLASAGCDELDPVKTESLCAADRQEVSMRCTQCQNPPYAAECSFCVKNLAAKGDPLMCEQGANPSTNPDGGETDKPDGATDSGGSGTTGEAGEGGRGGAGSGGAGKGGQAGGGKGGSGGAAGSTPDVNCNDDLWCLTRMPERPACYLDTHSCVQCTMDKHCGGMSPVCNMTIHRCQNCVDDPECGGTRKCDKQNMVCVDCIDDKSCTDDPVKNQCDDRAHSCVDCVTNAGCMDQAVNRTCDASTYTCVDCMEDGDCNEAGKPACDKPNRTCVGCLNDGYCAGVNGSCDTDNHVCVDCTSDDGCGGTTPRCNRDEKKCVACLDDVDCPSGHCFEEGQTCVECEADEDCDDPAAAHCDANSHRCVSCTSSTHCGHLSDTRACDTTARRCVECNDDTTCAGKSCIRGQHECSDVTVGSVSTCEACKADSMCGTNMKCIPMSFGGTSYGTYCAFTQSSRGRCSSARPYSQASSVRSVDGSSQSYCVPPASTTCEGVLDLTSILGGGANCETDDDCGLGMGDGNCTANRACTYGCTNDMDCPAPTTCLTGLNCGI
jgi:hypothetical protein